jgi:hypothetical protein
MNLRGCNIRLLTDQSRISLSKVVSFRRKRVILSLQLLGLSYPILCLLVAGYRLQDNGFDQITFAMLDDIFQRQVKASQVAPVTVDGASIGMLKCNTEILMTVRKKKITPRFLLIKRIRHSKLWFDVVIFCPLDQLVKPFTKDGSNTAVHSIVTTLKWQSTIRVKRP